MSGRSVIVTYLAPPHMTRRPKTAAPPVADDPESFVRAHQAGVWRYLRLLGASATDADDLLQETFLAVLRKDLPGEGATPLLRTIARGLWIDRHRWLARRRAVAWAEGVDAALAAAPRDVHLEHWLDALAACREELGERPRRALELTYRDGLGRPEVAAALGLAPNTVRNLLARTRDALRRCIGRRMADGDDR